MKIVSKFHVPIFYTFLEINRQKAVRSGRAIVLNDRGLKIYLKVFLKLFECHRGDLTYDITANRNER